MSGLTHERSSYLSRSWDMLTRDEGWIKPILLLSVALFIPIIGWFAVLGYGLEWARLTAWNIDAAPKQRGVDVGGCIKSGARAFVIFVVYEIVFSVVSLMSAGLFLQVVNNGIFHMIFIACHAFFTILVLVAMLHAALYQRISAAYAMKRLCSMVCFDVRGLICITAISLTCFLSVLGVLAFFYSRIIAYYMRLMIFPLGYYSVDVLHNLKLTTWTGDWSLCVYVFGAIISVIGFLVTVNAIGLWMRQFDVARWGSPTSPIEGLQTKSSKAGESSTNSSPFGAASAYAAAAPAPTAPGGPAPAAPGGPAPAAPGGAAPAAPGGPAPSAAPAAPGSPVPADSCGGEGRPGTCGPTCTCAANKNHGTNDSTSDISPVGSEDAAKHEAGDSGDSAEQV